MNNFSKILIVSATITAAVAFRRAIRETLCILMNGGHETYVVFDGDRIYQECLGCGHRTAGWDVTINPKFKVKAKIVKETK